MSNAGSRILRSVERARAYARGEVADGFIAHVPSEVDVKAIRTKLGLSQESFGQRFGFSSAAVRDWEQHRRQPEQAARVLLLVIDRNPDVVYEALKGAACTELPQSDDTSGTESNMRKRASKKLVRQGRV